MVSTHLLIHVSPCLLVTNIANPPVTVGAACTIQRTFINVHTVTTSGGIHALEPGETTTIVGAALIHIVAIALERANCVDTLTTHFSQSQD